MVISPNALNTPKRPQHSIKRPQYPPPKTKAPNYAFKTPLKHTQRVQDPLKRQKYPSKRPQNPLPPNVVRIFSSYAAKRRRNGPRAPGMTHFKNTPLSTLISSPISIHPVMTA